MRIRFKLLLFLTLLVGVGAKGQTDLTLYNMNFIPQSNRINPSTFPMTRINIGLPVISSVYAHVGNNGFKWGDLFELDSQDSLTLTADNMLSQLNNLNTAFLNFNTDFLSFGFQSGKSYFSFNATPRVSGRFNYPKDFLNLAWKGNGHPDILGNELVFDGFGADFMVYTEFGFGYARKINENLSVGGRLKYLHGSRNIYTPNSTLRFTTATDGYDLTASSNWEVFSSGIEQLTDSAYLEDTSPLNVLFPGNHGFGIDLGATWKIDDNWQVSASVLDLGFIKWNQNVQNYSQEDANFTFSGLELAFGTAAGGGIDSAYVDSLVTSLTDSLEGTFAIDSSEAGYNAPTIPRFHIGGNYFINDNMDAGLLFTGEVYKGRFRPSLTASFNARVNYWLSAAISYSFTNSSFTNLGLGFSVNAGPVQLYVVSDNVLAPLMPQSVKTAHVHTGINLTFGKPSKDRDGDGIPDKEDDCPDTPGLAEFQGCPDRDGDKIPDIRDACPDIPGLAEFQGCPDTDLDGITDSLDACPTEAGPKDLDGCPDRDGDKIIDKEDNCPDQPGPPETQGCPDKDRDGVLDSEDLCPEKPGLPENKGCPDSDGDTLFDHEDRCPEEFGPVDNLGCPYGDLDGDGVFDKEDRCVDTPGPKDNQGCPYGDLDGDGVIDKEDECPNVPGTVENNGCPELEEEEQEILQAAFDNLEFESGKSVIRSSSYESLDSLASLLTRKPDWKLRIAGHTDNVGSESTNMRLSKNRSNAVRDYLVNRSVNADRFIVEWYGESKPIYPNNTASGRQKNRRVEMEVVFE